MHTKELLMDFQFNFLFLIESIYFLKNVFPHEFRYFVEFFISNSRFWNMNSIFVFLTMWAIKKSSVELSFVVQFKTHFFFKKT